MGRLIVEAQGTAATGAASGIAAVGNSHPLYLVVSVTDADGVPVNGLAAATFTINARIVAPGGSPVEIASGSSVGVDPSRSSCSRRRSGKLAHQPGSPSEGRGTR